MKTPDPALSPEEAETALLAPLLFSAPTRAIGATDGPALRQHHRRLSAWMSMVANRPVRLGISDPPTTDGDWVFLPTSLPKTINEHDAPAIFRLMAMMQLGLSHTGLLANRAWMTELHTDWVSRQIAHLLMANWVAAQWATRHPGMANDEAMLTKYPDLTVLMVGQHCLKSDEIPAESQALTRRLTASTAQGPAWCENAVLKVIQASATGVRLVLPGTVATMRQAFRERRLGAPPVPFWVGSLHPGWFLVNPEADRKRANRWRAGPKPLQGLLRRIRKAPKGEETPELGWATPPVKASSELIYPEWDHKQRRLVPDIVQVTTFQGATGDPAAIDLLMQVHRGEIAEVKAQFASLRTDARWHHAQRDGSALDLDRVVAATVAHRLGGRGDQNLFLRYAPTPQKIAVLTLVDLTGSSTGALLRVQQKAVVFFAEGLKVLGADHAFFGFNGRGPKGCQSHQIKSWDEPTHAIKKRLAGLVAGGGSRLGAHIRHGAAKLNSQGAPKRLLLVISDGKPEDGEEYRGLYGIHDTAVSVREAKAQGVHVHCLSLSAKDGTSYLRTIFGPGGFTQVSDIALLPRRLPEAFCALIG